MRTQLVLKDKTVEAFPFLGLVQHIFWFESKRPKIIISIKEAEKEDYGIEFVKDTGSNILDVLTLHFSDIDNSPVYDTEIECGNAVLFTEEMAKQIVCFVKRYIDVENLDICVHCHMGVSRSVAVCAAITKWLGYSDQFWFDNGIPNMFVFRVLLNAFNNKD